MLHLVLLLSAACHLLPQNTLAANDTGKFKRYFQRIFPWSKLRIIGSSGLCTFISPPVIFQHRIIVHTNGIIVPNNDSLLNSGWKTVTRGTQIPLDLESRPLLVRSNATVASDRQMWIGTIDKTGASLAGIRVKFSSPMTYVITRCQNDYSYPTLPVQPDLTAGGDSIWRFSKTNSSLSIWCNGETLVEYRFATSNRKTCLPAWEGDVVESIGFSNNDDASTFYTTLVPLEIEGNTFNRILFLFL